MRRILAPSSQRTALPRLAALYRTTGYRVPREVIAALHPGSAPAPAYPTHQGECRVDAPRPMGESRGAGDLRIPPPGR